MSWGMEMPFETRLIILFFIFIILLFLFPQNGLEKQITRRSPDAVI